MTRGRLLGAQLLALILFRVLVRAEPRVRQRNVPIMSRGLVTSPGARTDEAAVGGPAQSVPYHEPGTLHELRDNLRLGERREGGGRGDRMTKTTASGRPAFNVVAPATSTVVVLDKSS